MKIKTLIIVIACASSCAHAVVQKERLNFVAVGPDIRYTNDGGVTWHLPNVPPPPVIGNRYLGSVECSDEGQSCLVVGNSRDNDYVDAVPVSYYTRDGGKTWQTSSSTPKFNFGTLACDSNVMHCLTSVVDSKTRPSPYIYLTEDGGNTWQPATAQPPLKEGSRFHSVTCDKTGTNCVLVGSYSYGGYPVAYFSHDRGYTWQISTTLPPLIDDFSNDNILESVACDADAKSCMAVGHYESSQEYDLSSDYISLDGGMNWQASELIPPQIKFKDNRLQSVSCGGDGKQCVAVGSLYDTKMKLMSYVTKNGGKSWQISKKQPEAAPNKIGFLESVKCDSAMKHCVASGQDTPFFHSEDGGNTWSAGTISPFDLVYRVG